MMLKLLGLSNKIKTFISITWFFYVLLFETLIYISITRSIITLIPFKSHKKYIDIPNKR